MNRRQIIADAALYLFAEKGYDHASTQLIAKEAGVSEALIFKHFGSKDQLLTHIIKTGYKRIVEHNRGVLQETNPIVLIHKVIELPYKLVKEEHLFWKLQYRLADLESSTYQHRRFIQPVYSLLVKAFEQLNYPEPVKETTLVLLIVDALWKKLVTGEDRQVKEMLAFVKTKYPLHKD